VRLPTKIGPPAADCTCRLARRPAPVYLHPSTPEARLRPVG